MRILHLNSGNETGGGMVHILSLLEYLKNRDQVILGVFCEGEMLERAREKGIEVAIFKQRYKYDISITKDIKQFILDHQIDILHTHGPRANTLSLLIKRGIDIPWYITVHSNPHDDFLGAVLKGKLFTWLHLRSFKRADKILAISERFRDELVNLGIQKEKIMTILNGIDFNDSPRYKYERSQFGFQESDFILMMVARLEPVKNHEVALFALEKLVQLSDHFKLVLIGNGSRLKELQRMVFEMGLSNHVSFLGQRDDVPDLLELADVTILTSKSESFPLVLLESARAKKPVISTDVGDVKLLIPTQDYGGIIDVGDVEALIKEICRLDHLKKEGKLKLMGERLYLHAKTHFSLESFAESVWTSYKASN